MHFTKPTISRSRSGIGERRVKHHREDFRIVPIFVPIGVLISHIQIIEDALAGGVLVVIVERQRTVCLGEHGVCFKGQRSSYCGQISRVLCPIVKMCIASIQMILVISRSLLANEGLATEKHI